MIKFFARIGDTETYSLPSGRDATVVTYRGAMYPRSGKSIEGPITLVLSTEHYEDHRAAGLVMGDTSQFSRAAITPIGLATEILLDPERGNLFLEYDASQVDKAGKMLFQMAMPLEGVNTNGYHPNGRGGAPNQNALQASLEL